MQIYGNTLKVVCYSRAKVANLEKMIVTTQIKISENWISPRNKTSLDTNTGSMLNDVNNFKPQFQLETAAN